MSSRDSKDRLWNNETQESSYKRGINGSFIVETINLSCRTSNMFCSKLSGDCRIALLIFNIFPRNLGRG